MRDGETGLPEEDVRRALAHLGADADSAPGVPASVTARIGAALRSAPPPAHSATAGLPRLGPLRVVALVIGIGAVAAAVAVAIAVLLHSHSAPRFPPGPTAERITVSSPPAATPGTATTRP
ncbi:hypothetical protein DVS77_25625 [Mycolicibacterium moriokaense]|nr:hypothetical protein DVS77_25625 [Mycolicibacterium moriokaense]